MTPELMYSIASPSVRKRFHPTSETGRDELEVMMELHAVKRVQAAVTSPSMTREHKT